VYPIVAVIAGAMASVRNWLAGPWQGWLEPAHVWALLARERPRYVLAWSAALVGGVVCIVVGWVAQNRAPRADGNTGHVSLDFSGHWLMGRLLIRGEGRFLYERSHQRAVLREAFPIADQDPNQEQDDAETIMGAMMGSDDDPARASGPLYPPINAFFCAPLGVLSPRIAYRLAQISSVVLIFLAAAGISLLSQGRFWWPVAALTIMVFPGIAGTIALGQNALLSLTIFVWGWVLIARGRPGWGGVIWGLLAYKPVWAMAFFLVPVLTRRWRMALAMLATGTTLALLTLPFVGWHSWLDWLQVGREANQTYNVDENWIECSRDLLSVARRWLIDFNLPSDGRDLNWLVPALIGWSLLLFVLEYTMRTACLQWHRSAPLVGPGAAFVLLGAWLCCYHFMYYDVMLAALPVLLLFTEPRRYLEPILLSVTASSTVVLNRMAPTILALLIVTQPLWYIERWRMPPGDTFLLLILWVWCGWRWMQESHLAAVLAPRGACTAAK
jgi:hypothetical protein